MAISFEEIKMSDIIRDVRLLCKREKVCGECKGEQCLIGYAKKFVEACREDETTYVDDGVKNLPQKDSIGNFDSYELLRMLARLLVQCRACRKGHYENCMISVLRNCLEIIEFGETLPYEGTPLEYLMRLNELNQSKARIVLMEYRKGKEAMCDNA